MHLFDRILIEIEKVFHGETMWNARKQIDFIFILPRRAREK